MSVRLLAGSVPAFVLVCLASSVVGHAPGFSLGAVLIGTAQAQTAQQKPLEKARTAVETLINRLRGRDMPEGIVKTNGRIEATQVDVAAKYPGRLAKLTKDEGDEVTAGEVVATISSPETEAQLRAAQAQVLKAKQALAEAVALIAQRKSDLDFAKTDYERGQFLVQHQNISQQAVDLRRNKFEAAEAALTRPMLPSMPQWPMSSDCNRSWSTWCSCRREVAACSTGSPAPARLFPPASAS